jgi:hypothetical protein
MKKHHVQPLCTNVHSPSNPSCILVHWHSRTLALAERPSLRDALQLGSSSVYIGQAPPRFFRAQSTYHSHSLVLGHSPSVEVTLSYFIDGKDQLSLRNISVTSFHPQHQRRLALTMLISCPAFTDSRSLTAHSAARLSHEKPSFSSFLLPHPWRNVKPHISMPTAHPPCKVADLSKQYADSVSRSAS